MSAEEQTSAQRRFAEIVAYLKTCVTRPLTKAEIDSAWEHAEYGRTLENLLEMSDIERKRIREDA